MIKLETCGHVIKDEECWCLDCVRELWEKYQLALAGCKAAAPWIMSTSPWAGEAEAGRKLDEALSACANWQPKHGTVSIAR